MTDVWYWNWNQQKCGPYTLGQLKQFAVRQLLRPTDMLLQHGAQRWVRADSVADLFVHGEAANGPTPVTVVVPHTCLAAMAQPVAPTALSEPRRILVAAHGPADNRKFGLLVFLASVPLLCCLILVGGAIVVVLMLRSPEAATKAAKVELADFTLKPAKAEPALKAEPPDPLAFTQDQYDRIRNGLSGMNIGQMLMQRTHPTGTHVSSGPPRMVFSANRHEIIVKVTVTWDGGFAKNRYQTDYALTIIKDRVVLGVERDTAVFKIDPTQLKLAEVEVTDLVAQFR